MSIRLGYPLSYPEASRALTLKGAELIAMPISFSTWAR